MKELHGLKCFNFKDEVACFYKRFKTLYEKALQDIFIFLRFCLSFLGFSLGRDLLSCILEIVDVPEVSKERMITEDDFAKILDWCDIWIILFQTTGKCLPSLNMYSLLTCMLHLSRKMFFRCIQ